MLKLIVNPGTEQAWEIALSVGTLVLGSGPENAWPIEHETVSAAHCEVVVADGSVTLRDLDSRCGTFVNHAPIMETTLTPGQMVSLGDVQLKLVSDGADADSTTTPPLPPPMTDAQQPAHVPVLRDVHCKYHPRSPAVWTCRKCRAYFCDLCVTTRATPGHGFGHFCRRCGSECAPVQVQPDETEQKPFLKMLPEAFSYPFKGNGAILLAAGTVFFALLRFVASLAGIGPYGGILILLVSGFVTGYVFSYVKRIITSTVNGDTTPPDWPDFGDWQEDIAVPLGQCLALVILAFGPAIILRWWHPFGDAHAGVTVLVGTILGGLLAPMGLLALAMFDSVGALNPIALVWSILRIPGQYLMAAAAFELVVVIYFVAGHWIGALLPVPVLPGLIGGFVNLYLITAGTRILGLLYLAKKDALGWFKR